MIAGHDRAALNRGSAVATAFFMVSELLTARPSFDIGEYDCVHCIKFGRL
jgi:hypothetical protein